MLWLEPGHYVHIEELASGPHPLPLKSGFNRQTAYRVLGMFNPSETAEAYLVLCNDFDQMWFISNRHVRLCDMDAHRHGLRTPLIDRTPSLNTATNGNGAVYHAAE
jgi:hypothetical protein